MVKSGRTRLNIKSISRSLPAMYDRCRAVKGKPLKPVTTMRAIINAVRDYLHTDFPDSDFSELIVQAEVGSRSSDVQKILREMRQVAFRRAEAESPLFIAESTTGERDLVLTPAPDDDYESNAERAQPPKQGAATQSVDPMQPHTGSERPWHDEQLDDQLDDELEILADLERDFPRKSAQNITSSGQ